MSRLQNSNLVTEWDCYFDFLAKAFANCTKTSFHNIPSQLMYIGYAVANNLRINFAQLIWTPMVRGLIAAKRDLALGNKINYYYPRFLTIILNHKIKPFLTTGLLGPRSIVEGGLNTILPLIINFFESYADIQLVYFSG